MNLGRAPPIKRLKYRIADERIKAKHTAQTELSAKKVWVLSDNVKGKRIVLIDDSIVRGNTMGIGEIAAAVWSIEKSTPPLRYACYMGINIPSNRRAYCSKEKCGRNCN
uniref:Phosphoribosyltransferase domain-containing protein n=1 Tax=Ditylenchus dipsaci TaxID=166011 RepID=A0A915EEH4_9BILA